MGIDTDIVSAIEVHALSRLTLQGQDLTLGNLTGYRVTAVAGAGESILQGGVASADGSGLTVPIQTRRIIAGSGITLTPAAGSLTIAAPNVSPVQLRAMVSASFDTVDVGDGDDGSPVPVLSTFSAGASMTISPLAGAEVTFLQAGTYICTLSARLGVGDTAGVESRGAIGAVNGIGSTSPSASNLEVKLHTRSADTDVTLSSTQRFTVTVPGSSITFRFEHEGGVDTLIQNGTLVCYHYV